MNAKSLTIGGALVLLAVTLIGRIEGLIADEFLILSALIIGFACLSYIVSWSVTQAYKVLYYQPRSWTQPQVKRDIYRCAIIIGALTMLACGSFFLLAEDLTSREKVVLSVFWCLACAFVGFTSPFLWRFVFDNVMPRLRRWAKGKDENELEAEALNRPTEKPE